jgi:hypothetical protein
MYKSAILYQFCTYNYFFPKIELYNNFINVKYFDFDEKTPDIQGCCSFHITSNNKIKVIPIPIHEYAITTWKEYLKSKIMNHLTATMDSGSIIFWDEASDFLNGNNEENTKFPYKLILKELDELNSEEEKVSIKYDKLKFIQR